MIDVSYPRGTPTTRVHTRYYSLPRRQAASELETNRREVLDLRESFAPCDRTHHGRRVVVLYRQSKSQLVLLQRRPSR